MSWIKDKRQCLLIFLILFVCVFIFLLPKTNQQDSSMKTDVIKKNIETLYTAEKAGIKQHFKFELNTWKGNLPCSKNRVDPLCESCYENEKLWDCVGEDRDWSVVFVDHSPYWKRKSSTLRLLKQCEVMVIHDTEPIPPENPYWPEGWCESKCKDRQTYTDTTRVPWTQVLQGDLDSTGEIFNRTVASILAGKTEYIYKKFNSEESPFGSHIKVLSAAAMSTSGDVLEMGTGYFSTPILHDIVSLQGRMLVSTDSDLNWLSLFSNLSKPTHQIIGVPVFEDGAHCGDYDYPASPVLDHAQLSVMGDVTNQLKSNRGIKCPNL